MSRTRTPSGLPAPYRPRTRRAKWLGLAFVIGSVFAVAPAVAQVESRLAIDDNRTGNLFEKQIPEDLTPDEEFEKQTPEGLVPDILKGAATVQNQSGSPASFKVFAYRVSRGRVADRFESKPFTVKPGAAVPIGGSYLPPTSVYGGKLMAGPQDFVLAQRAIPVMDAMRDPARQVTNGIFRNKPADWSQRDAMYLIVVPADAAMQGEAKAYPLAVFLK